MEVRSWVQCLATTSRRRQVSFLLTCNGGAGTDGNVPGLRARRHRKSLNSRSPWSPVLAESRWSTSFTAEMLHVRPGLDTWTVHIAHVGVCLFNCFC